MINFIYLMLPIFFVGIYLTFRHFREHPYDQIRRRMGQERKKSKVDYLIGNLFTAKRRLTFITIGSVGIGVYLAIVILHATPLIGAVIGGVLPYIASETYKERWLDKYEEGVAQALEYGAGVFEAGATVEQWVRETADEVEGPVSTVFESGRRHVLRGEASIVEWLKHTARNTPSQYFSYVLWGIIANYEQASSLDAYMREVLDELSSRKRYERAMRLARDEAMKLLGAISLAPVVLYLLFSKPLNNYLAGTFTGNLIFGIGLMGYTAIVLFARQTATAKPKI